MKTPIRIPLRSLMAIALFLLSSQVFAIPSPPVDPSIVGIRGASLTRCDIDTHWDKMPDGSTVPGSLRQRIGLYNQSGVDGGLCNFLIYFLYSNYPGSPLREMTLSAPLNLSKILAQRVSGNPATAMGTYIMGYGTGGTADKLGILINALKVTEDPTKCAFMIQDGFAAKHQIKGLTIKVRSATQAVCDQNGTDLLNQDSLNFSGKKGGDPGAEFEDLTIQVIPLLPPPTDLDGDGRIDADDNCPRVANPNQEDLDQDNLGDACDDTDSRPRPTPPTPPVPPTPPAPTPPAPTPPPAVIPDKDGDGVLDSVDNCPDEKSINQVDTDNDKLGDVCDDDDDADTVKDAQDNCPLMPNTDQADKNNNKIGDKCELGGGTNITPPGGPTGPPTEMDQDGDGLLDQLEEEDFGTDPKKDDTDGDGLNDGEEIFRERTDPLNEDSDGDDYCDGSKVIAEGTKATCKLNANGKGDNCPLVVNADQADDDQDGFGNVCENDRDGDTILDDVDNCIGIANKDQNDTDLDGVGDACDPHSEESVRVVGGGGCSLNPRASPPRGLVLILISIRNALEGLHHDLRNPFQY